MLPDYPLLHDTASITDGEVSSPSSPDGRPIPTNSSIMDVLMLSEANNASHSDQDSCEDSVCDEFLKQDFDLTMFCASSMQEALDASSNDAIGSAISHPRAAMFAGGDATDPGVLERLSADFDAFYEDELQRWEEFMANEQSSVTATNEAADPSLSLESSSISEDVVFNRAEVLEQFKTKYIYPDITERFDSERFPVNELGYREYDVIFGRGPSINNHLGNVRFRKRAAELEIAFHRTKSKKKKKEMSMLVLESFLREGVRFKDVICPADKSSKEPEIYAEVDDETAREKVRTLLHDGEYNAERGGPNEKNTHVNRLARNKQLRKRRGRSKW